MVSFEKVYNYGTTAIITAATLVGTWYVYLDHEEKAAKTAPAHMGTPVSPWWPYALLAVCAAFLITSWVRWAFAKPNGAEAPTAIPTAKLILRFFGDQRSPERLEYDNIFRWYSLRNIFVTIDRKGKATSHAITVLFLTFENPVIIGTFTVTSPDMQLPMYEVKDFSPRSAVVAFTDEVPAGTLVLSVHQ